MASAFRDLGQSDIEATRTVALVKLLVRNQDVLARQVSSPQRAYPVLETWLGDSEVQQYLQVNRHRGVLWFNKEAFERVLATLLALAIVTTQAKADQESGGDQHAAGRGWLELVQHVRQMGEDADYQLDALMAAAKEGAAEVAQTAG